MTILQALEKWDIKEKVLLKMLSDGNITGIRIESDRIILPDIPKPLCIPQSAKNTAENIYKYILSAVNSGCYLDANIFGEKFRLTDTDFKDFTNELERCGMLRRKSTYTDSFSTLGFIIAADKLDDVNKIINRSGKRLISALKKLNINIGTLNVASVVL